METKSLCKVNENSLWGRIKSFLYKIFYRKKILEEQIEVEKRLSYQIDKASVIEEPDERTLILQERLENHEIELSELSDEQKISLIFLYRKQIQEKIAKLKQEIAKIKEAGF